MPEDVSPVGPPGERGAPPGAAPADARDRPVEAELRMRVAQQAAIAELGQEGLRGAGRELLTRRAGEPGAPAVAGRELLARRAAELVAAALEVPYSAVMEPAGADLEMVAGVGWPSGVVGGT